jgi:hypothetical protein
LGSSGSAFARWADDTDTSPLRLARKVLVELAADSRGAPLLVVVDDAHLLDDLSALVVHEGAAGHGQRDRDDPHR